MTGGTGLIGSEFIRKYANEHSFTVVSRNANKARQVLGDSIQTLESIASITNIEAFDAVINLAGEPIADKRWTDTQKKKICDSRWSTTAELVAKINASDNNDRISIIYFFVLQLSLRPTVRLKINFSGEDSISWQK